MFNDYFNISIWEYLVNIIIFGQCLFFMLVYEKAYSKKYHYKFTELVFYVLSILFIVVVYALQVKYNYYKPHLLIQYVILVNVAYYYFKKQYKTLEAISLSFLIVFLNSYWWEIVLHFTEYTQNPLMLFNFRESIHLIVIPFLMSHYHFYKHDVVRKLSKGIMISYILLVINYEIILPYKLYLIPILFFPDMVNIVWFINRVIALHILIQIMMLDTIRKRKRDWWFS